MARRDDLYAGTTSNTPGTTLEVAVNEVLYEKKAASETGEISLKHYRDLHDTSKYILSTLPRSLPLSSLRPNHYALLRSGLNGYAPVTIKNALGRISAIFRRLVKLKYLKEIDDADALKRPSARALRLAKPTPVIVEPAQLRALVAVANPTMKAMTLLGINAAYINSDCGRMTLSEAKDALASGWLNGRRNKTGVERCCKLWPETIAAIQLIVNQHPGTSELLFLTHCGSPWRNDNDSAVAKEFKKVADKAQVPITFARLRHHFQTIAEERTLDTIAVKHVMGHCDHSISNVYRDRVLKERIEKVCNAVRTWYLSGGGVKKATPKGS
jgi:integrase